MKTYTIIEKPPTAHEPFYKVKDSKGQVFYAHLFKVPGWPERGDKVKM